MTPNPCSLSEFNLIVKQSLEQAVPDFYWITAEINEISVRNGNCYIELIEKEAIGENIVAKARANIWSYQFRMLRPYFVSSTGRELEAGLKVMLKCKAAFHELYGFSLQVFDIDPTYTVGELALKKMQIIKQLEDDGVIDMNRELVIPEVPQRIAVVSSPQAAGFGDFADQLSSNEAGYRFEYTLFSAIMQGNEAEASVTAALEQVFEREDEFDVVVIIRGGGSQSDLHCFNSYSIAASIAQFPLPVITGIGHDRDETIADRVANTALKTPTAVAEFLISRAAALDEVLQTLAGDLVSATREALVAPSRKIQEQGQRLQRIVQTAVHQQDMVLLKLRLNMQHYVNQLVTREKERLERFENRLHLSDPVRLLEIGYTMTIADGKIVRSASALSEGQTIVTRFSDGAAESVVRRRLEHV